MQTEVLASWVAFSNGASASNANGQTAPDGAATADKLNWTATNISVGTMGNAGVATTQFAIAHGGNASIWALNDGTNSTPQFADSAGASQQSTFTPGATWQRFDYTYTAQGGSVINVAVGRGNTVPAGSCWVWGAQAEQDAKYPSSYLPTTTATKTRDADVLSIPSPSLVAPGGRFDFDLVFAPNYSSSEQGADHNLLYFGANDRVFLQQSTRKVVLRIGGADVLSNALTWSREQTIRVRARHASSGRYLEISGAASGNGSTNAGAASALTLPGTAYLLGSNTGAEECADLRVVRFGAVV